MDKAEFFWVIVGDSEPEPAAVTGEEGARMVYTIGCPDPFPLDAPDANVQLVCDGNMYGGGVWKQDFYRLAPPEKATAADIDARRLAAERRLARDRKRGIIHGYAGFGARAAR